MLIKIINNNAVNVQVSAQNVLFLTKIVKNVLLVTFYIAPNVAKDAQIPTLKKLGVCVTTCGLGYFPTLKLISEG